LTLACSCLFMLTENSVLSVLSAFLAILVEYTLRTCI